MVSHGIDKWSYYAFFNWSVGTPSQAFCSNFWETNFDPVNRIAREQRAPLYFGVCHGQKLRLGGKSLALTIRPKPLSRIVLLLMRRQELVNMIDLGITLPSEHTRKERLLRDMNMKNISIECKMCMTAEAAIKRKRKVYPLSGQPPSTPSNPSTINHILLNSV